MGDLKRKKHIVKMCLTAMFCAVITFCSWISFPMPGGVAITLQIFAVSLCGCVLGPVWGGACVAVYILVGASGFPVFSLLSGGVAQIAGPTGGFLIGFLALAVFCGISQRIKKACFGAIICFLGLVVCHFFGIVWFMVVTNNSFLSSVVICSLPYILKDIILVSAAIFTAKIKIIKKLTI